MAGSGFSIPMPTCRELSDQEDQDEAILSAFGCGPSGAGVPINCGSSGSSGSATCPPDVTCIDVDAWWLEQASMPSSAGVSVIRAEERRYLIPSDVIEMRSSSASTPDF